MSIRSWVGLGCGLLIITLVGCSAQVSTQGYADALTKWSSTLTTLSNDFQASDAFSTVGADRIVKDYQTSLTQLKAIKPPVELAPAHSAFIAVMETGTGIMDSLKQAVSDGNRAKFDQVKTQFTQWFTALKAAGSVIGLKIGS
jgi:hypothetical protein